MYNFGNYLKVINLWEFVKNYENSTEIVSTPIYRIIEISLEYCKFSEN